MDQFEVLDGLPATGPMYVPVSSSTDPFYSEGYVVRFFSKNGAEWVGNFRPGLGEFSGTFGFPEHDKVLVVAGGQAYLMSPSKYEPLLKFGGQIEEALMNEDGDLIFRDLIRIIVIRRRTGELWMSERISWDGLRNLKVAGDNLSGEAWGPTITSRIQQEWVSFDLDLRRKKLTGGSVGKTLSGDGGILFDAYEHPTSLWAL